MVALVSRNQGAIMVCRMFKAEGMSRCLAVRGDHVPLVREREQYCLGVWQRCPVLAASLRLGRPLESEEHLEALWLDPEAPVRAASPPADLGPR